MIDQKNKWIYLLQIFLIIILYIPDGSSLHAYYKTSDLTSFETTTNIRQSLNIDLIIPAITINKNNSKRFSDEIFYPKSQGLVNLDEMSFSDIFVDFNHAKLPSEVELTNILYANLKLVLLVNEYEELQKNVRLLINQYHTPYLYLTTTASKPQKTDDSIASRKDRIKRIYEAVLRNQGIRRQSSFICQYSFGTDKGPSKFEDISIGVDRRAESNSFDRLIGSYIKPDTRNGYAPSHSSPDRSIKSDNGIARKENKKDNRTKKVREVPWLVKVLLGIIEFFYENKMESTIYLSILALILSLFLSLRSR